MLQVPPKQKEEPLKPTEEPSEPEEEYFRDSLEDGKLEVEDFTVTEETIVKEKSSDVPKIGITFVQGETDETIVQQDMDQTKVRHIPIQKVDTAFGETFVHGSDSVATGRESVVSGRDSVAPGKPCVDYCQESLSEQPIVTGNATFLSNTTGRVSELGSVLEAPALHSTVLAPRPSQANEEQSPDRRGSMMSKPKPPKLNWKSLGHVETLTPIGKRQSQMHHFHDLGESIVEKDEIVYESIEQEYVERIEEEIIETTTTETWIEDGKGGRRLLKRDEKTETIAENIQEFQSTDHQSNAYHKLIADDPVFETLPGTPVRRTTFQKDDPTLPNTPVNRLTFHKDDPRFPDTPTHRMTFVKDDSNMTPGDRMAFVKDDPNIPGTPVRRDTFLKQKSALENTPVISSDTPPTLNRSPKKAAPPDFEFQFGDGTQVDREKKKARRSKHRRSDTYTKSIRDLSPKPVTVEDLAAAEVQKNTRCSTESIASSGCYETPETSLLITPVDVNSVGATSDNINTSVLEKSVVDSNSYTKEEGISELLSQSLQEFGDDWTGRTKSQMVEDISGLYPLEEPDEGKEAPGECDTVIEEFKDTPVKPLRIKKSGKEEEMHLEDIIHQYLSDEDVSQAPGEDLTAGL